MTDNSELRQRVAELHRLLGDGPEENKATVGELWVQWFDGMKNLKAEGTIKSIEAAWKHLGPIIVGLYLEDITNNLWTNTIIPIVRANTHQEFKHFNQRKFLSMFCKWCEENGKAPRDWKRPKFTDPDPERNAGKCFTDDEILRLVANAQGDLLLQVLMAFTMGMRKSEILLLRTDRIDREKRTINLKAIDCKIRKGRSFRISDDVWPLLEPRLDFTGGFVFPGRLKNGKSLTRSGNASSWATLKRNAKVKGRFHDLRCSFLTRAFRTATNPALICASAGLSIEVAMKVYCKFTDEDLSVVGDLVRTKK